MVRKCMCAVLLSVALMIASGSATASAIEFGHSGRSYQIYLLKGLADIFSSGMDALAVKLQARRVVAEVHNHVFHDTLAQTAIAKWRGGAHGPVIIIGHSFGADAAFLMAQRLNDAGVPVALLVTFGPVVNGTVPANVSSALNYFQSNSVWHGQAASGPDFHGSLANVDLADAPDITHFTIDKAEPLHATTIGSVLNVIAAPPNTGLPRLRPGRRRTAHEIGTDRRKSTMSPASTRYQNSRLSNADLAYQGPKDHR